MGAARLLLTSGAGAALVASIAIGTVWPAGPSADPTTSVSAPATGSLIATRQQQAARAYANLPVSFVENGARPMRVCATSRRAIGFGFFITPSEVMLSFAKELDRRGARARTSRCPAIRRR